MRLYQQKESGQTLIEVMIALFVLTTGFLGILSLLAQSIYLSKVISNQTIGAYLAAEGIEVAKNIIDHDVYQHIDQQIAGPGWGSAFGSGGNFELDNTTCDNLFGQFAICQPPSVGAACATDHLYYDSATQLYLYPGDDVAGSPAWTPFTRCVTVTPNGADEITVRSTVAWQVGLGTQQATLEDHFYNWHP